MSTRRAEQAEHFGFVGEAPLALLREHELAVREHVELAVAALVGRRLETLPAERGRETRGPAVVAASDGAVVDLDGHGSVLPVEARRMPGDDAREVEPGRERAVDAAVAFEP